MTTLIAEKIVRAGGPMPWEASLRVELARLVETARKAGGTNERIGAILSAVAQELLGGQNLRAADDCGQWPIAAEQPKTEARAMNDVPPAIVRLPSASVPVAHGVGQGSDAGQVHSGQRSGADSVREPSPSAVKAGLVARHQAAVDVFSRELTHTGRQWGNVTYRELDSMMDDGELARAVKAHIGHLRGDERHKMIRELMTPREFLGVLRKVRKHNA